MENNSYLKQLTEVEDEGQAFARSYDAAEDLLILQNQRFVADLRQQQNSHSFENNLIYLRSQNQSQPPIHHQEKQNQQVPNSSPTTTTTMLQQQGAEKDFLGALIEEVRLYRCLWDSSCRAFKELPKKQQAWKQIAEKLNVDGLFLCIFTS